MTWGFKEDAREDDDVDMEGEGEEDPSRLLDEDAYYYKDPKKALKTWCEQRGFDMVFKFEEEGLGSSKCFVASIELEIDGGVSRHLF